MTNDTARGDAQASTGPSVVHAGEFTYRMPSTVSVSTPTEPAKAARRVRLKIRLPHVAPAKVKRTKRK